MGYKSITQLILFVTSVVIIFTYIQPSFLSIKETQDEVFEYADASNKASELNAQLSKLVSVEKSFSRTDIVALEQYLPTAVDQMAVMADISTMAQKNGLQVTSLDAGDVQLPDEDVVFEGERVISDGTSYTDFTLAVEGDYTSFKAMLKAFEQNKYPLEIVDLAFGEFLSDEDEVVTSVDSVAGIYDLTLRTYAYSNINN